MDSLISTAIDRTLYISDLGLKEGASPEDVRAFCDSFARRLVELYQGGKLTWAQADAITNHIYLIMVKDCGGRVPDYAWDVYLAFDTGECTKPGGDATTRPLIEAIQQRYTPGGRLFKG